MAGTVPVLSSAAFYGERASKRARTAADAAETASQEQDAWALWLARVRRIAESGCTGVQLFQAFPRQDAAFAYADSVASDHSEVFVFAKDRDNLGHRLFIVSTLPSFWAHYEFLPRRQRVFYEVIRQGSACHLYLDVEHARDVKQSVPLPQHVVQQDDQRVSAVLAIILPALSQRFGVTADERHVVNLDSSDGAKFSRHLIIRIPGVVFQDNITVGYFVQRVFQQVVENGGATTHSLLFHTVSQSSNAQLIVDLGVYTRNRNFRVYRSTKFGKRRHFQVASQSAYAYTSEEDMFKASLVTYVPEPIHVLRVLDYEAPPTMSIATIQHSMHPSYAPSNPRGLGQDVQREPDVLAGGVSVHQVREAVIAAWSQRANGVATTVRSWVYFPSSNCVVFHLAGNRWCERIGRAHRSNNVMIVVQLRLGTFHQRCFDYDCRGWSSAPFRLPGHLCPPPPPPQPRQAPPPPQQRLTLLQQVFAMGTAALDSGVHDDTALDATLASMPLPGASRTNVDAAVVTTTATATSPEPSAVATMMREQVSPTARTSMARPMEQVPTRITTTTMTTTMEHAPTTTTTTRTMTRTMEQAVEPATTARTTTAAATTTNPARTGTTSRPTPERQIGVVVVLSDSDTEIDSALLSPAMEDDLPPTQSYSVHSSMTASPPPVAGAMATEPRTQEDLDLASDTESMLAAMIGAAAKVDQATANEPAVVDQVNVNLSAVDQPNHTPVLDAVAYESDTASMQQAMIEAASRAAETEDVTGQDVHEVDEVEDADLLIAMMNQVEGCM